MRTSVYFPLIAIFLLGVFMPIYIDGSVLDYEIYQQSSQWGNSLIAHADGDGKLYRQLQAGDTVTAYYTGGVLEYTVIGEQVYTDAEWLAAYGDTDSELYQQVFERGTSHLYLQTCVDSGVLVIETINVDKIKRGKEL